MSGPRSIAISLALATAALSAGCTSTRRIAPRANPSALDRVNDEAHDREVRIVLRDVVVRAESNPLRPAAVLAGGGAIAYGTGLHLDLERATWDDEQRMRRSVPLEAVSELSHQSAGHPRVAAAFKFGGLGALIGGGAGAIIGLAAGDDKCDPQQWCLIRFTAGMKAAAGAVVLGGLGLVIGTIAGAASGEKTVVQIVAPPASGPPSTAQALPAAAQPAQPVDQNISSNVR